MIKLKSPEEIELMKEGGKITEGAMHEVLLAVREGISLFELNTIAEDYIKKSNAQASFKTVDDYDFATCINVNEGIVHGIPNDYMLKSGDVVSVDLGVLFKGFHTDLSYTVEVSTNNEEKFLETGKKALNKAIEQCITGNRLGDVSAAIQETIEKEGYTVSEDLVGHGIGRKLHEAPYVMCYGNRGEGIKLKEGMVFAIEVIYQKGNPELTLDADGWTLKTADGSLSGLFESTVAVGKSSPIIIANYFEK